jgi:hypothetical protein
LPIDPSAVLLRGQDLGDRGRTGSLEPEPRAKDRTVLGKLSSRKSLILLFAFLFVGCAFLFAFLFACGRMALKYKGVLMIVRVSNNSHGAELARCLLPARARGL